MYHLHFYAQQKIHCLFCGTLALSDDQKRRSEEVHSMSPLKIKATISAACEQRHDEWAENVQARLLFVHDMPAADALYHQ